MIGKFGLGLGLYFAICANCLAATSPLTTPEQCILAHLNVANPANSYVVRSVCVQQFIEQTLGNASSEPLYLFDVAELAWFPRGEYSGSPHIEVHLLNKSGGTIIAADIALTNKKTGLSENFRTYATYPIDAWTVGALTGDVITVLSGKDGFLDDYTWKIDAVYATSRRESSWFNW